MTSDEEYSLRFVIHHLENAGRLKQVDSIVYDLNKLDRWVNKVLLW